jgi:hypothetical protein
MAKLTVPSVFKPALAKLAAIPAQSAAELISAVGSSQPVLNPKKMALQIGPATPSISGEDLEQILTALFSLSAVRVLNKVPITSFLDDVCESLHPRKNDVDSAVLRSRLEQLLQSEPVVLAAKGSAIQREYPNVIVNARVLTDLRPVFGDGPETLQSGIITHNLKLTYLESNEMRESFFAMDDDDLTMLQKSIVRAQVKSKTLREFIVRSGLPNMEPVSE